MKRAKMLHYTKKEYVMKPLKSKVSITLDSDIIEKLKLLAEAEDRSFSQYINLILKNYLSQKECGQTPR